MLYCFQLEPLVSQGLKANLGDATTHFLGGRQIFTKSSFIWMKDSLVHNVNINIQETTEIRAVESHIKVAQTVSSLSVMCNSHERVLFTIFKLYLS